MPIDPWALDAVAGSPTYNGQDSRLALGAAFVHATNALGVRSGVIPNGGLNALWTTAQGTPNMTVNVATGQAVVQGSTTTTQGPYVYTLDSAKTVTIAAAHATLPRIDLVAIRVRDSNVSGSGLDGDIVPIAGTAASSPVTPGLPADGASYLTLATVSVPAAATSIATGQITNQWTWTTTAGGCLLVETKTKLDAVTTLPMGQLGYVWVDRTLWAWNGAAWRRVVTEDEVGVGRVMALKSSTSATAVAAGTQAAFGPAADSYTFKAGRRYLLRTFGTWAGGAGITDSLPFFARTSDNTAISVAPSAGRVPMVVGTNRADMWSYYEPGASDVTMAVQLRATPTGGTLTGTSLNIEVRDDGKV
jgi:hypothetical protein